MADYKKTNWKAHKTDGGFYVRGNVARKPKLVLNPEIEYGHSSQAQVNRERQSNKEFAQAMNRRYIGFLLVCAIVVFAAAAFYLSQISDAMADKEKIQKLEAQLANLKSENSEKQSRMDAGINAEELRRIAIEELGMVYAGTQQVESYDYEESDYVRQYESIPKR